MHAFKECVIALLVEVLLKMSGAETQHRSLGIVAVQLVEEHS